MTSIDFYFNAEDRLQVACRLAGKAMAQKKRVLIYAPEAETAQRIDKLLWTWPATGFVPHCAPHDPLAAESHVAEMCKWISIYTLAVAAETYHVKVADEQEILGAIADMIGRTYAIDSVVQRVRQMPDGHPRRDLARELLTAYAPRAYGFVLHTGRHVLMDVTEGAALDRHLAALDRLRMDWPTKVIAAKRRIAAAVIEAGGYPL